METYWEYLLFPENILSIGTIAQTYKQLQRRKKKDTHAQYLKYIQLVHEIQARILFISPHS